MKRLDLTLSQIEERLFEAIRTLRALPDRERRFIHARQCFWPDIPKDVTTVWMLALERLAVGDTAYEAMRSPPYRPSKQGIDRLDETLEWLSPAWISKRERTIITLRAFDMAWIRIGWRLHTNTYFVQKWHKEALTRIRGHLRDGTKPRALPQSTDGRRRKLAA